MWRKKCLLLVGGSGQLGNEIVQKFRLGSRLRRWRVFNVDLQARDDVDENYIVDPANLTSDVVEDLHEKLAAFDEEFECIINAAGKWYAPNSKKYLRMLKKEQGIEGDDLPMHPLNIGSADCFNQYEDI